MGGNSHGSGAFTEIPVQCWICFGVNFFKIKTFVIRFCSFSHRSGAECNILDSLELDFIFLHTDGFTDHKTWNQLCREEPSEQENPCDNKLADETWLFLPDFFPTPSPQIPISECEFGAEGSCKVNPGNFQ